MNILMSGISHEGASIDIREKFGLSEEETLRLLDDIGEDNPGILGIVLLNTCNRTEIYISAEDDFCKNPGELLCSYTGLEGFSHIFTTRQGDDVFKYLSELSCGLHSRIFGEDQIITQVKEAIRLSRSLGLTDPVLESLFRCCVTAGKEIKGTVPLRRDASSAAQGAILALDRLCPDYSCKNVLIIGNGEMGRLCAGLLINKGSKVTVTLRTYKHGETIIPSGCEVANYSDRYLAAENAHIIISATKSPHFTLSYEEIMKLDKKPEFILDLAIPRDAEPEIAEIPGVTLLNIDHMGTVENDDIPPEVNVIIKNHLSRFKQWAGGRNYLSGESPKFPLFIDIAGKKAVVVGGGTVALRRAKALLGFGADVEIISPEIKEVPKGAVWTERCYQRGDIQGAFLVVTATDDRELNKAVGKEAKSLEIPVSVSDRREECSFFFPALCFGDGLIAAVVGDGEDHRRTSQAAKAVRNLLEDF